MATFSPEFIRELMSNDELGLLDVKLKVAASTEEERLRSRFEEIVEFVRENGREPNKKTTDMKERSLASRLTAMSEDPEQYEVLQEYDEMRLLEPPEPPKTIREAMDNDPLGLLSGKPSILDDEADSGAEDIFNLKHVPKQPKPQVMPDDIAKRRPCKNFEEFEHLFKAVHEDLRRGRRKLLPFKNEQQIFSGMFYLYNGVVVYINSVGERVKKHGKTNARLHTIFENGQESNMLLRSLATELYKGNGKRITEPNDVTLERMGLDSNTRMGSVYVLRSLSTDLQLSEYPYLHKIGHTTQKVEQRVAKSLTDTTFLNAEVEVIAEYTVPAVATQKIESILHTFFSTARLDIAFERSGKTITNAHEWFNVPLKLIDEAIALINSEAISSYEYDFEKQIIKLRN